MIDQELSGALTATRDVWLLTGYLTGQAMERHGLTSATFQALWAIDPTEPAPSMAAMSERLHCNPSNLTFIANQLVAKGFVVRAVNPTDRRSRVLELTETGAQVRAELLRTALEKTPLASLSQKELRQLRALLARALRHN